MPRLKTFLKKAVDDEYIKEADRIEIRIEKITDKSAKDNELFLRNNEVMALYNYECDNKQDELIKDLFLLECTTGYRLSDVTRVDDSIEESFGVEEVTLVTKKTSTKIRCQLIFDIAKKILEKYNYSIPAVSQSQKSEGVIMNRQIKIIAKNAGIKRMWMQSKHHAGDSKPTVVEKQAWEFIKTHTGRHTFICLLKLRGWDNGRISKYTGQTIKVVEDYARSLKDSDYSMFDNMRKSHPELIVKLIDEVSGTKRQDSALLPTRKGTVLDGVFGYKKMVQLVDLIQHEVNVIGSPLSNECRQIILSTSNLSKAIDYCKGKDLSELKKKAFELEQPVKVLTRLFSNTEIYRTYEYKLFKLGLIREEEITPTYLLEQMFTDSPNNDADSLLDEYESKL